MILRDFNHCKLELSLPGFEQYVRCDTRQNRVLDKYYGNIKNAYTAKPLPPLSNSDHSDTVQLIPIYKTAFKRSKPQTAKSLKRVVRYTEGSKSRQTNPEKTRHRQESVTGKNLKKPGKPITRAVKRLVRKARRTNTNWHREEKHMLNTLERGLVTRHR